VGVDLPGQHKLIRILCLPSSLVRVAIRERGGLDDGSSDTRLTVTTTSEGKRAVGTRGGEAKVTRKR
jgi:hypothetical protein